MVGNRETLEHVRALAQSRELTGQIILHCRRGKIEALEIREKVEAPWKARLTEAQDRQNRGSV